MDARSGEVLLEFDGLTRDLVPGSGPGGNLKTGRYRYGSDRPMFDITETITGTERVCTFETPDVRAVTARGSFFDTCGEAFEPWCGYDNTYQEINGAYSPINDAFAFAQIVYHLYDSWYGIAPLPDQLCVLVHIARDAEVGSYWNGTNIVLGDGDETYHPFAGLDTLGHEISHAFTEKHSGLTYRGQSGAINEAFSDMAGEAAKFYDRGQTDWQPGADIVKGSGAMRYMDDPTRDGHSIGNAADYVEGMDLHHASGVFNKAFYLLATNPAWDVRTAFNVFVRANRFYWTPTTDFASGAIGVADAAHDLGYDEAGVWAAFRAVGIDPPCPIDAHEPDDYAIEATPLHSGDATSHSICTRGDRDWTTFFLTERSAVTIETSGPSGDTVLSLYDLNGTGIAVDDDGGAGQFSRIERACGTDALAPGAYNVRVQAHGRDDEIDAYTLALSVTPCGSGGVGAREPACGLVGIEMLVVSPIGWLVRRTRGRRSATRSGSR